MAVKYTGNINKNVMHRTAVFSPCEKYRYALGRQWHDGPNLFETCIMQKPGIVWLMLNPSTADLERDDPTVTRCIRFSQDWGFGHLTVLNLFAFRSTDPELMLAEADPVGPENDAHILRVCSEAEMILCAWGNHGKHRGRSAEVRKNLAGFRLHCLSVTGTGEPIHPLYQAADTRPIFMPDLPK